MEYTAIQQFLWIFFPPKKPTAESQIMLLFLSHLPGGEETFREKIPLPEVPLNGIKGSLPDGIFLKEGII